MYIIFLIAYLLVAVILVFLIMLQDGKGIDIGGNSFNMRNLLSGVGTNPNSDLITRLTAVLGVLFFIFSLLLGNISSQDGRKDYVHRNIPSNGEPNNLDKVDDKVGSESNNITKS